MKIENGTRSLASFSRNEGGLIKELNVEGPASQRLMAMGVMPGSRIRVVSVAPLGDPITIEGADEERISLRRRDAACVMVSTEST